MKVSSIIAEHHSNLRGFSTYVTGSLVVGDCLFMLVAGSMPPKSVS